MLVIILFIKKFIHADEVRTSGVFIRGVNDIYLKDNKINRNTKSSSLMINQNQVVEFKSK